MPKPRRRPEQRPREETWQVARVRLRTWIAERRQKPFRPWMILAVSTGGLPITAAEIVGSEEPSPEQVAEVLEQAMASPRMGPPRRPGRVVAGEPELVAGLAPQLAALGIRVEQGATPLLAEALASLEAELGTQEAVPDLLKTRGVTPEQAGRVFAAAADFYRQAPWRRIGDEFPIAVRYPAESQDVRYAVVMGAEGVTYGLAMYRSAEDLEITYSGVPPEMVTALFNHEALTYGDVTEMPFSDLEAIERYGWEVAGERAYPLMAVFTKEEEIRRPGPKDLAWYEAALRAIPTFVIPTFVKEHPRRRWSHASTEEATLTVPIGGREARVTLSYAEVPRQRRFRRAAGPKK